MTQFDTAAGHPVGVHHHRQSGLPFGAQVQVVLIQLAQQFPAPLGQRLFQRTVVQGGGAFPVQERAQPDEQQPTGRETLSVGDDVANVVVASGAGGAVLGGAVFDIHGPVLSIPSYSGAAVGCCGG